MAGCIILVACWLAACGGVATVAVADGELADAGVPAALHGPRPADPNVSEAGAAPSRQPPPHVRTPQPTPPEAALVWHAWQARPGAVTPSPLATMGRRCRTSGGSWVAAWAACRCPRGRASVAGVGCSLAPPPRPLDPALPPHPWAWPRSAVLHLGSRTSGCAATADPAATAPRPQVPWPPPALPQHTWHAGRATAGTRKLASALRRRRWPEAFGTTPELGGSAALGVSYLDAAALARWWPGLGPDGWAPPSELPPAWALGAPAPTPPSPLGRACQRLARSLRRKLADAPDAEVAQRVADACRALRFAPRDGAPPRPQRARLALAARRNGPPAWRVVQPAAAANIQVAGTPGARWEVGGVGEAVLQRRLTFSFGDDGTLLLFVDASGRGLAFAVHVGRRAWLWYDAQGRATRPLGGRP